MKASLNCSVGGVRRNEVNRLRKDIYRSDDVAGVEG